MAADKNNFVDMGNGEAWRVLLTLAVPSMLSMFFQNLYALMDTVFVSWVSTKALAAMSICIPVFFVTLALAKGISAGITTMISYSLGRNDHQKISSIEGSALGMMIFALLPFAFLVFQAPGRAVLQMLGANGDILSQASEYMFWLALSFPVMGYAMVCESFFMGRGNSRIPMKAMIMGNIINLFLNPFFIFKCGMGVAGSSLATLFGYIFSAFYLGYHLKKAGLNLPSLSFKINDYKFAREISAFSVPIAFSYVMIPISFAFLNFLLAGYGPAAIGAWNLASRIEMMFMLPLLGLSAATVPFVGYNLGRNDFQRIKSAVKVSIAIGMCVTLSAAALFISCPRAVLAVFKPELDVLELGSYVISVSALGYFMVPFELTLFGIAQGLKHPGYVFFINLFRFILARISFAYLLSSRWGVNGVYWSHPCSMVLSGLLSLFILWGLIGSTRKKMASAIQTAV